MDMEKKNLFYLSASFCLLLAITIGASFLKNKEAGQKSADLSGFSQRLPASLRSGNNKMLLSFRELRALKQSDLEKYLKGVSKVLIRAGKKNPSLLFDKTVKSSSSLWIYLQNEAFAASGRFEGGCLIGFIPSTEASCEEGRGWTSMSIDKSVASKFANAVNASSNSPSAVCPVIEGTQKRQQLCSPAIYGFNFNTAGKASLICLPEASGSTCFNSVSTNGQGDRLKKSLDLLAEANPEYWDNMGQGITDICKPRNNSDLSDRDKADCAILSKQLETLTQESRGRLASYVNLKALMDGEADSLTALSNTSSGDTAEEVAEAELNIPSSGLCSKVEEEMTSQPVRLSQQDEAEIMSATGASKDSIDFLKAASAVCGKPLDQMINEFGVCGIEAKPPVNAHGQESESVQSRREKSYRDANRFMTAVGERRASEIKALVNSNNDLRVRQILEDMNDPRYYQSWLKFREVYGTNPVDALEKFEERGGWVDVSKMLGKITGDGNLSGVEEATRSDFRSRFGLDIVDLKGIFCDDSGWSTYDIGVIRSPKNFNAFATPCLKQMGMDVIPNNRSAGIETISGATIRDRKRRERASRAPKVRQACTPSTDRNATKGVVIDYLNSGASFSDDIYQVSKNFNGETICKKIVPCTTRGMNSRLIRVGDSDKCIGGNQALNAVSSASFRKYSCSLSINSPNSRPQDSNDSRGTTTVL